MTTIDNFFLIHYLCTSNLFCMAYSEFIDTIMSKKIHPLEVRISSTNTSIDVVFSGEFFTFSVIFDDCDALDDVWSRLCNSILDFYFSFK